jgi:hypothetical protein
MEATDTLRGSQRLPTRSGITYAAMLSAMDDAIAE